jgi:Arc/MetJ-type ribon-helix-helix transcriptional regulator
MAKPKIDKRKYSTITIPTPIFEKIQAKIKGTSFSSVSDYVTYVLRETGSEIALKKGSKGGENDKIIEKLRALGYT